jgi:uncharacterized protein YdhG (YjbR/CyaY superfamily)
LRDIIKAAAPEAEECMAYGIPGFRLNGYLVGYGAGKNHCSFYPGGIWKQFASDFKGYDTSKGTIRFEPNESIPPRLIRKLVKARVAQNAERRARRAATKAQRAKAAR